MATVDFGGGLGVPYFSGDREFELEKFGQELNSLMSEIRNKPVFMGTKLIIEPGRYLVAEAGIYVVQVNDVKLSHGKKFLIVDGGMNHHLAASGNLGQVIKRNFPIAILSKLDRKPTQSVDVVGPLCTPLDVLARDTELPSPEIGDRIGIFQSGAYARTASPLGFLSHLTPAEVLVENGQVRLIRRRGTYRDLLADIPAIIANTENG
jgi:diaminopimelate decarboxylase